MPVLFDEAGYDVTVCDPPYAGYQEIPDLSIYDNYPEIDTYITQGNVSLDETKTYKLISNRQRNLFCYSIVKTFPVAVQPTLYNEGNYHQLNQLIDDSSLLEFERKYDVLKALPNITQIHDKQNGSFVMIENDTTHNNELFEDSEFLVVNNNQQDYYDDSTEYNGKKLDLSSKAQLGSYQTNIAALKRMGEWLDYLKEQDVYDNTRIIIVSDHGFGTLQMENFLLDKTAFANVDNNRHGDAEFYFPLLLVKDFNSVDFSESDEFMTNADVPVLATKSIFESPKNPFTGKIINNSEKTEHDQLIIASNDWIISKNNGNQFLPARWYSIHDSIWNKKNWKLVDEEAVLTENSDSKD